MVPVPKGSVWVAITRSARADKPVIATSQPAARTITNDYSAAARLYGATSAIRHGVELPAMTYSLDHIQDGAHTGVTFWISNSSYWKQVSYIFDACDAVVVQNPIPAVTTGLQELEQDSDDQPIVVSSSAEAESNSGDGGDSGDGGGDDKDDGGGGDDDDDPPATTILAAFVVACVLVLLLHIQPHLSGLEAHLSITGGFGGLLAFLAEHRKARRFSSELAYAARFVICGSLLACPIASLVEVRPQFTAFFAGAAWRPVFAMAKNILREHLRRQT